MTTVYYDVTPSSTSGLAGGDVIFTATSVGNAGAGYLDSLTCYNYADRDAGIDVYFLRSNVSIGAANAAMSISDANLDEVITKVSFSSGAWSDATNGLFQVKDSEDDGMDVYLQGVTPGTSALVYIAGVINAAGGFSSGGLGFRVGIRSD